MEEQFFFKNSSGKELFGVIHYPEKLSSKGVLICHPLFEEKLHVHRVLVDFSRLLCSSGFSVMRFDYYGDGDSQGEFEEATLETRLSDIGSALDFFRNKTSVDKLALLGVRFGATLASLLAEKNRTVDFLILWAPILKGNDYINSLLRMNLAQQVVVHKKVLYTREDLIKGLKEGRKINVEGYEITKELYEQISKVDLLAEDKKFKGRALLFQFSQNSPEFEPELENLRDAYSKDNSSELLKCTDPPFWGDMKSYPALTDDLFGKTLSWIKINL
jgi:exosortase A-associated hydrolase 2